MNFDVECVSWRRWKKNRFAIGEYNYKIILRNE
jgi:hypothetical protein